MDKVFKALADDTRRYLLDRLHERNGQTLSELCASLGMTRQSATQHLGVLEAANLVTSVRRGREKLHYLNPVPLHEVQDRWISRFERPRLDALNAIKRRAETVVKPDFVYVTYIESTAERVWEALTDADLTATYWGHRNESTWEPGAPWAHRRLDSDAVDVVGTVVESTPPTRLVTTWAEPATPDVTSTVTFHVEQHGPIVRLTVTHENLASESDLAAVSGGWPAVLSNLKSLLETGSVLPTEPWHMPARSV
ncbi:metalloregulator ArsR/SmtB family transcription factor [Actinosynnema sp. NPDC020468]|uniref:ArsR/SmtB family transcription factor n=1 Tax=Actinosynnema sp. NPDC020468 TaxID=3154488 RepID=UPI0033E749B7